MLLRQISDAMASPIAVLLDLTGPKVRMGEVPGGGTETQEGDTVVFATKPEPGEVEFTLAQVYDAAQVGDRILIADGDIGMVVTHKDTGRLVTTVTDGGLIKSHQGLTLVGRSIAIDAITEKDIVDLKRGIELGVDWVAASFIHTAGDMLHLRSLIEEFGGSAKTMAKVETQAAVDNLDDIIDASDGIMIARGDLGLQTPFEDMPHLQKLIIRKCLDRARPVITATQMLESMIENSRPTRAEATDVANAILDGTDAVMLSGETAIGKHPTLVVETMARIAERADCEILPEGDCLDLPVVANDSTHGVAFAAVSLADALQVDAVLCCTTSGTTARMVSMYRPQSPIVAVCSKPEVMRQLALTWGVRPILSPAMATVDEMIHLAYRVAIAAGYLVAGQRVVITAGVPPGSAGHTNLIMVGEVSDSRASSK